MPHATRSTGAAFRASHTRVRILLIALAFILGAPMPSLAIEVRCDFNGDGIEDLAVSAPESNFKETQSASGSVHVFLGTEVGLSDQSSIDIFGGSLWIDPAYITHSLGERVACGDFDGNGLDDLAIGAREMVHVFLATGRADLFSAATSFAEFQHSDYTFPKEIGFGTAGFASGDFDGDGYDDLAVGAPGVLDRFGGPNGLVYIYWGREPGLHRHWVSFFYTCAFRSCGGVGGSGIGGTIHVGNVNGDEYDDLFVDMGGTWVILHGDGNGYPVGPDVRSHYRFDPDTNAGIPADDPWHGVCRLDSCLNGRFVGVVSDFDGDGFDDVITRHGSQPLILGLYRGSPKGLENLPDSVIHLEDIPHEVQSRHEWNEVLDETFAFSDSPDYGGSYRMYFTRPTPELEAVTTGSYFVTDSPDQWSRWPGHVFGQEIEVRSDIEL